MSMKAYSSYTVVDVVDGMQWQSDATSHPTNPKEGWAYYNTKDKCSYLYDGTKWVVFAKDGSGVKKINMHTYELSLQEWQHYGTLKDEVAFGLQGYDNSHIQVGDTVYLTGIIDDVVGVGGQPAEAMLYGVVTFITTSIIRMIPSHVITSGANGDDGHGISEETLQYAQSASYSSAPTSGWGDFPATWDKDKPYVWKRTKQVWNYKDANGAFVTKYTTPQLMSQLDVATIMAQQSQPPQTIAEWCVANDVTVISGAQIASGTITANQIKAKTITADQIASRTITAEQIKAETITADQLAAHTITAYQIDVPSIVSDDSFTLLVNQSVQDAVDGNINLLPQSKMGDRLTAIPSNSRSGFGYICKSGDLVFGQTDKLNLKQDEPYTLSFYAWSESEYSVCWDLWVPPQVGNEEWLPQEWFTVTSTPKLYQWVLNEGVDFVSEAALRFINLDNNGVQNTIRNHIYITDIKIEDGERATNWSLAPEDNYIESKLALGIEVDENGERYAYLNANADRIKFDANKTIDITSENFSLTSSNLEQAASLVNPGQKSFVRIQSGVVTESRTLHNDEGNKGFVFDTGHDPVSFVGYTVNSGSEGGVDYCDINGSIISLGLYCDNKPLDITVTYSYPAFTVLDDGSVYANAANLSGNIEASGGHIGGWSITPEAISTSFKDGDDTYQTIMGASLYNNSVAESTSFLVTKNNNPIMFIRPNGQIASWREDGQVRTEIDQGSIHSYLYGLYEADYSWLGADISDGNSRIIVRANEITFNYRYNGHYIVDPRIYYNEHTHVAQLQGSWTDSGGISITSDERQKNSIESLDTRYSTFFDELTPRRFKYNDGTSDRYHTGYITQEVQEALKVSGIDEREFAGIVTYGIGTDEEYSALRYNEFIPLLTNETQKLKTRVSELEKKNEELEERLAKIEELLNNNTK